MIRRLALLVALAVPLSAQVSETIEVAVTNVDVVVTDAKGNRIRGLTKDDFEVLVDGKPREITNFAEYAVTGPTTGTATATINTTPGDAQQAAPPPPRRVLIVFDNNTLTSKQRRGATAAAISFIDTHVRSNDRVMIGVLSQQFSPRTDWSTDHAELRRVIEAIGSEAGILGADAERKRAEEEINYLIDLAAGTAGTDPRFVTPPTFQELISVARRYAEVQLQETRASAQLLGKVVSQFAAYPEKKALVVLGEGLDTRPGWELFEKLQYLSTQGGANLGIQIMLRGKDTPTELISEASRFNAASYLRDLADAAYKKGVPIYAVNPGTNEMDDIESTDSPNPGQQFARLVSKGDGYKVVGDGSGGAAFLGMRADLALTEIARDLGTYYSLGFRATGVPSRATIRVRTKTGGHRVRTALAGGGLPGGTDSVSDAVTAHHVMEPATNELEIMLDAAGPVANGAKQKVTLQVIIPIRNLALVRQGEEVTGGFDVYLSVSDGKGYFSEVSKQSHAIKWRAADVPQDDDRTMTYSIEVTMEPGTSQISVGVVDQRSKKTGYDRIEVQG